MVRNPPVQDDEDHLRPVPLLRYGTGGDQCYDLQNGRSNRTLYEKKVIWNQRRGQRPELQLVVDLADNSALLKIE